MVNESTITEPTVPEIHFLIMHNHSFHWFLEFIQFTRDLNICLVCLPRNGNYFLQPLDVGIFDPLNNVYSLEIDE